MKNRLHQLNRYGLLILILGIILPSLNVYAQNPVIKIDLNFSGRNEAEIHEKGYNAWPIVAGTSAQRIIDGVKFELKGNFKSEWYKAGVQAPYYARLVNDGLVTQNAVELTITGLNTGTHTLLAFHNNFDNTGGGKSAPIAVYVDGKLVESSITPTNRATHTIQSQLSYITLNAKKDVPVVVRYQFAKNSSSGQSFTINGFELNTPDLRKQARMPMPIDGDEHVDLGRNVNLRWNAANKVFQQRYKSE